MQTKEPISDASSNPSSPKESIFSSGFSSGSSRGTREEKIELPPSPKTKPPKKTVRFNIPEENNTSSADTKNRPAPLFTRKLSDDSFGSESDTPPVRFSERKPLNLPEVQFNQSSINRLAENKCSFHGVMNPFGIGKEIEKGIITLTKIIKSGGLGKKGVLQGDKLLNKNIYSYSFEKNKALNANEYGPIAVIFKQKTLSPHIDSQKISYYLLPDAACKAKILDALSSVSIADFPDMDEDFAKKLVTYDELNTRFEPEGQTNNPNI